MRNFYPVLSLLIILYRTGFAQSTVINSKPESINVQSPTTASLGTFGKTSIAQFIGTPNIDVPLYTFQEGSLQVPITLRYSATGFRPDEHPGWVGMGWGLEAGGVITRVVNRMPDELIEANSQSVPPVYGFYYTNQVVRPATPTDWTSADFLKTIANRVPIPSFVDTEPDEFSFALPGCSGVFYKDSDGDNGAYGSNTSRGGWKVRCDQPVRVAVNNAAESLLSVPFTAQKGFYKTNYNGVYPKSFAGFTITTADGTRYVFGHDEGSSAAPPDRPAIEYSTSFFTQADDYWTASAWYLTKIISTSGKQITLNYNREAVGTPGRFVSQMYNAIAEDLSLEASNNNGGWLKQTCNNPGISVNDGQTIIAKAITGKLVAPVYLQSIKSQLGEVTFDRSQSRELRHEHSSQAGITRILDVYNRCSPKSNGASPLGDSNYPFIETTDSRKSAISFDNSIAQLQWRKLDAIKINFQGQLLRTWRLTYSDNPAVADAVAAATRLTLLTVAETGKDGGSKPPYQFTYYNGNTGLPEYLMFVSDHWGFYNNVSNEASSTNATTPNIPDYQYLARYQGLRDPNSTPSVYLRGVLTSVKYPTGGTTTFDYEQHRYGSQVDTVRTKLDPGLIVSKAAGGLRIKRITSATVSNPQPGDKVVTEYYYVKDYTAGAEPTQLPSSGILGGQIKYIYSTRVYQGTGSASNARYARSSFSSQSVLPACGTGQGGYVGYSQVVEKRSDGSYKKYFFSNFDASVDADNRTALGQPTQLDVAHFDEPPLQSLAVNKNGTLVYDQFSSRAHERGKLLQTADYTASGTCVQRQRTTYTAFDTGTEYVRFVYGRQLNVCQTSAALEGVTYKLNTYAYLPSTESITVYNAAGTSGVTTTKTHTYQTYQNRTINLPLEEGTSNSKGQALTTRYRYPFNYANVPMGANDPVAKAIAAMPDLYILNSPVEVLTLLDGNITSATVQTYTFPGASTTMVKPFQTWQLELAQSIADNQYPRAAFAGTGSAATFQVAPNLRLKYTYASYNQRGNPLTLQTEGNASNAYVWGYGGTLLTAQVGNASRVAPLPSTPSLGNEASYVGFESGTASPGTDPDEDYWNMPTTTSNYIAPVAHTGNFSWHLGAGNGGLNYSPGRAFQPSRQQLRYKFSAWVKTETGFGEGEGRIVLGVNRQDGSSTGSTPNCYQVSYFGSTDGRWRYVEVVVDLNAAHTSLGLPVSPAGEQLQVSAYIYNVSNAGLFMDDVRFQPVESLMTTATHAPGTGPTSQSDANGHAIYYEYDGLQRLRLTKDWQGNVLKHLDYHYQR